MFVLFKHSTENYTLVIICFLFLSHVIGGIFTNQNIISAPFFTCNAMAAKFRPVCYIAYTPVQQKHNKQRKLTSPTAFLPPSSLFSSILCFENGVTDCFPVRMLALLTVHLPEMQCMAYTQRQRSAAMRSGIMESTTPCQCQQTVLICSL